MNRIRSDLHSQKERIGSHLFSLKRDICSLWLYRARIIETDYDCFLSIYFDRSGCINETVFELQNKGYQFERCFSCIVLLLLQYGPVEDVIVLNYLPLWSAVMEMKTKCIILPEGLESGTEYEIADVDTYNQALHQILIHGSNSDT